MKTKVMVTIFMALSLGAFSAMPITAETRKDPFSAPTEGKREMSHDHMMMANEPHHVLAMAYHKSLATFAKALHEHTAQASSVNVTFTRAAVAEMRRSFDQMKQQHQEHMQTMSAEMHTKMSGMMQQMETHQSEMNTELTALEQEVQSATADVKKVSTLAASVHTHLQAMSKMHRGSKGSERKIMKM